MVEEKFQTWTKLQNDDDDNNNNNHYLKKIK